MMVIENKFDFGESVYLSTDKEQLQRIVTGFTVRMGAIVYGLTCGTQETWHYDFEISKEKNILIES